MSLVKESFDFTPFLAVETFKVWIQHYLCKHLSEKMGLEDDIIENISKLMRVNKDILSFVEHIRRSNINLQNLQKWMEIDDENMGEPNYIQNKDYFLTNTKQKYRLNPKFTSIDVWRKGNKNNAAGWKTYIRLSSIPSLSTSCDQKYYKVFLRDTPIVENKEVGKNEKIALKIDGLSYNDIKHNYSLIVKINKNLICDEIAMGNSIPYMINYLSSNQYKYFVEKKHDIKNFVRVLDTAKAYRAKDAEDFEMPENIKNINLFAYQKLNVKWLVDLEVNPKKYEIESCVPFGNVYYCPYKKDFSTGKSTFDLGFKGGCVLDEVGLGKTIVAITLVAKNKADETEFPTTKDKFVFPQSFAKCPAILKSGKNKGKVCGKKVTNTKNYVYTYCSSHRKSGKKIVDSGYKIQAPEKITIHTRPKHYIKIKRRISEKICSENIYLKSRATLVIGPNQLPFQWREQIAKFTDPTMKVVTVSTLRDFDTITYRDILNADFVITTLDFLNSNTNSLCGFVLSASSKFENDASILSKTRPEFYRIYWQRVIIDEIHKINDPKFKKAHQDIITKLMSKYRHGLSSSAFEKDHESFNSIMQFLCMMTDKSNCYNFNYMPHKLIQNHFRKNDKTTTSTENLNLPKINELIYWLKLNNIEKAMYDARIRSYGRTNQTVLDIRKKSDVYLRQLCCYPMLSSKIKNIVGKDGVLNESGNMTDIAKQMFEHLKNEVTKTLNDIKNCITKIFFHRDKLDSERKEILPLYLDDEVNHLNEYRGSRRQIKRLFRKLASLYVSTDTYQNILITTYYISKRSFKIPQIFLKPIEGGGVENGVGFCCECNKGIRKDCVVIMNCGHFICNECNKGSLNCKTCSESVKPSERIEIGKINMALENASSENSPEDSSKTKTSDSSKKSEDSAALYITDKNEYENMIYENGTKLANLVLFLQNKLFKDPDNQVIIFSQWDNLLNIIRDTLHKYDIESVLCKGNVYVKNCAVRKFKHDAKHKVLLMSHKYTASGLDLTEANYVIFADPVYHDKNHEFYQQSVELQAIGRAHRLGQTKPITAVRFLVKDSVEELIYQETKGKLEEEAKNKCEFIKKVVEI